MCCTWKKNIFFACPSLSLSVKAQSTKPTPMEIVLLTVSFVSSHINYFLIWRLLYSVSPKPPLGEMRSKRINQCKTTFLNAFFSLFQNSWRNTRKVGDILKRWDLIRETNVSHIGKPVLTNMVSAFRSYWKKENQITFGYFKLGSSRYNK